MAQLSTQQKYYRERQKHFKDTITAIFFLLEPVAFDPLLNRLLFSLEKKKATICSSPNDKVTMFTGMIGGNLSVTQAGLANLNIPQFKITGPSDTQRGKRISFPNLIISEKEVRTVSCHLSPGVP